MVNAVVYVRPENYSVSASRCLEHCTARKYNVVGLIPGDWDAAMRMLREGTASVVVVSSADQLDAGCEPRVEVVPKRRPRRSTSSSSAYAGRRFTQNDPGAFRAAPPAVPARPTPSVHRNASRA